MSESERSDGYDVIYADPPWKYDFSRSGTRRVENHYETMEIADIEAFFREEWAKRDCVLYLWATAPKLPLSMRTMEAWGFEYKTHAVWDKEAIGMGYWFRGVHELILVGTRGRFSPPPPDVRVASIFSERRTKHSAKPRTFREYLDRAYPTDQYRKIELFARERAEGWDVLREQEVK